MYSKKMRKWKDKWKVGKVPNEMVEKTDLWRRLGEYWMTPEAQALSATNSSNRRSDRNGKRRATHNLGSTSNVSPVLQLKQMDGQPHSFFRCLKDAHTNRCIYKIDDPIACEICETVRKREEEFLQSQESVDGPTCTELFLEMFNEILYELTSKAKGHVYGLFKDVASSRSSFSASYGGSCDSVIKSLNEKVVALEEQCEQDKLRFDQMIEKDEQDQLLIHQMNDRWKEFFHLISTLC